MPLYPTPAPEDGPPWVRGTVDREQGQRRPRRGEGQGREAKAGPAPSWRGTGAAALGTAQPGRPWVSPALPVAEQGGRGRASASYD